MNENKTNHNQTNNRITVPSHLLDPKGGDHYVLKVVGDSMAEEMICDGDYVVVLRRDRAQTGEMVIVLVGDDVSIKRWYPEAAAGEEQYVRLQPANAAMKAIRVPAKDVRIQGIVVGLMRKF